MCLLDTKRIRFTIFPKKVYKIVYVEDGCYYSPYRCIDVKLMQVQYPYFKNVEPSVLHGETELYEFGDGFVFGYTDLIEAIYAKHNLERQHPRFEYVIIKGIIPPFTRYAREDRYPLSEVCARKMFWYKVLGR